MSSDALKHFESRQSRSQERAAQSTSNKHKDDDNDDDAAAKKEAKEQQEQKEERDKHTSYIIKKFGLEDIVPRIGDYEAARAEQQLPLDGHIPIFAGGKPIHTRRESSSPAVVDALRYGFKLAHYPARALLPEDMFSKYGADAKSKGSNSPDPALPSASRNPSSSQHRAASSSSQQMQLQLQPYVSPPMSASRREQQHQQRIPGDISPHVLPHGALLQPLPAARELMETQIPLAVPARYSRQLDEWQAGVDVGSPSWALSDPEMIIGMARHYRRCFPRTARDDTYDELPTSRFSGNYILRRYGGCFPEHCHYSHYRKYSEFGLNTTSEFHNYPAGRHPYAPI